jgi:hypothetical protein
MCLIHAIDLNFNRGHNKRSQGIQTDHNKPITGVMPEHPTPLYMYMRSSLRVFL